jgi:hypothetical protein
MFPSKASALAAILLAAASNAPFSVGEDASESASSKIDLEFEGLDLQNPREFLLRNNNGDDPSLVLQSSFPSAELHSLFQSWKNDFSRSYPTVREEAHRKLIWLENHARIVAHNLAVVGAAKSTTHTWVTTISAI